ncbi:MAG: response regulator [Proteobacteria bacterium]|nr:response regulator [Pseudomonadota bacterium]
MNSYIALSNHNFLYKAAIVLILVFTYNLGKSAEMRFGHIDYDYSNPRIRSIVENAEGYLLLGTDSGILAFDGYNLKPYVLKTNKQYDFQTNSIKKLFIDSNQALWVGTKGHGLYRYYSGKVQSFKHKPNTTNTLSSNFISDVVEDGEGGFWVGTDNGLNYIGVNLQVSYFPLNKGSGGILITSLLMVNQAELLIGTKNGLLLFDIKTKIFKKIFLENLNNHKYPIVYTLHKDKADNIWIGTQNGVYLKKKQESVYGSFYPEQISFKVISILSIGNDLWMGTIKHGLLKFSKSNNTLDNFVYNRDNMNSLNGNTILSLFHDKSDVMWIGTFYKGLNFVNTNTANFGFENDSKSSITCADSLSFYGFLQDNFNNIWMANNKAVIKYNYQDCEKYSLGNEYKSATSFMLDSNEQLWLSTTKGLYKYDSEINAFVAESKDVKLLHINFTIDYDSETLLLVTIDGLYQYLITENKLTEVEVVQAQLKKARINHFAVSKEKVYYFATKIGVARLMGNKLSIYDQVQSQLPKGEVFSLFIDEEDNLYVGTFEDGLYVFSRTGELLYHNKKFGRPKNVRITNITKANNGDLWIGTFGGLIRFNLKSESAHIFYKFDGLQANYSNYNSAYKTPSGKIYLGGSNGFNTFYPEDIKLNTVPPNIVLTNFTRFGKTVSFGMVTDGFVLEKPINNLEQLILSHKDYVVGFEFAALDFADPSRNQYAFMMEGLDPDWTYVGADDRKISYSNLKPGEYTFRVKGSNKDGVWNEAGKSLSVVVKPAPWLSWWAYAIYTLLFMIALFCFVSWRTRANKRITTMLRIEVDKQTSELQVQKQKVENLLAKKNEFFANVSHEFRTPLTLILGPIDKLLRSHLPVDDINALKMVNRNANRLLTMIEQLLQLTKISDGENIKLFPVNVSSHIDLIVRSFEHLAVDKKIDLKLMNNEKATINCTKDAIEIVVGNLLSNAIKYTQSGGLVTISSKVNGHKIDIKVMDTGCGLDDVQQKDIFNRFKRLDSHQNIEGIGIGLSVVEEILKVNNASIHIKSNPGEGSCFTVSFDTVSMDVEESEDGNNNFLIKQLAHEPTLTQESATIQQPPQNKHQESILIIEDNHDMRYHIVDVLKSHYHCMQANRGNKGIAMAIEFITDIIICDVMMPEMDGFHVTRVLRSDTRTSHIPLMLLTALDDRESRIRGWREHVDVYLTKPFDTQELLMQLENILIIRNILKKKAGQMIKTGKTDSNVGLPKKDREFVEKLNQLIIKKYKDGSYFRAQMASDMAVSERQLQRKLKALIDKNPMDLLREYRLSQAAIMLKDGYQVGISSDECGFNALSHFSKCFKSQFGMSPKAYQTVCKQPEL